MEKKDFSKCHEILCLHLYYQEDLTIGNIGYFYCKIGFENCKKQKEKEKVNVKSK